MNREEAKEILREAYTLYYQEMYREAIPLLEQGLEAGFVYAFVTLGDCYFHGLGVEADTTKAINYWLNGVDCGVSDAMVRMADVYNRCGEGQKALDMLQKAVSLDNAEALYNLGGNYFFGNSLVPQNYSKATGHKQAASDRDALQLGGSILDVR